MEQGFETRDCVNFFAKDTGACLPSKGCYLAVLCLVCSSIEGGYYPHLIPLCFVHLFFFLFFNVLFIYLLERERERKKREREDGHRGREETDSPLSREPNIELDPKTLGS